MATQQKPKLVEDPRSQRLVRFMILTSWLSFLASLWHAMFSTIDFFFLGIFWFVTTIILAAILGARKKE